MFSDHWLSHPSLSANGDLCPTPGKVRYQTEQAARRFALQMHQRDYHCRCGAWHLTSNVTSEYIDQLHAEENQRLAALKQAQIKPRDALRVNLAIGDRVYMQQFGYGRVTGHRDERRTRVVCRWDNRPDLVYRVINVNTNAINRWPF